MGAFLEVALPAFLLVFAGMAAARAGWIDEAGAKGLNAFVYYLAMPAALFRAASEGALLQGFDWRLVAAYFGPTLVLLAAVEALGRRKPAEERALTGMGACFSNNVFLGMPVIVAHMGSAAAGPMTVIIAGTTVLFIGLPVLRIEMTRGSGGAVAAALGRALANPLLVAIALGTLWASVSWRLPGPVSVAVDLLAAASAPAALAGLGAALAGYRIAGDLRDSTALCGLKLLAHPVMVWFAAGAVGLGEFERAVAVLASAMPVGANVFVLAQHYGIYERRASAAVVLSTLAAMPLAAVLMTVFHP